MEPFKAFNLFLGFDIDSDLVSNSDIQLEVLSNSLIKMVNNRYC